MKMTKNIGCRAILNNNYYNLTSFASVHRIMIGKNYNTVTRRSFINKSMNLFQEHGIQCDLNVMF